MAAGLHSKRNRFQFPTQRIEDKTERFQGRDAHEVRVAFFTKHHEGISAKSLVFESGVTHFAADNLTVCENELAVGMRFYSKPLQNCSRHAGVHRAGINKEV